MLGSGMDCAVLMPEACEPLGHDSTRVSSRSSGPLPLAAWSRPGMAKQLSPQRHQAIELPVAPEVSAQVAGLRYVSDMQPGIRRQRTGRGFWYRGMDGRPI